MGRVLKPNGVLIRDLTGAWVLSVGVGSEELCQKCGGFWSALWCWMEPVAADWQHESRLP